MPEFPKQKAHCSSCGASTFHYILAERKQRGSEQYDEHYEVSWAKTYELLECCGCETVHLTRTTWFSEWGPDELEIRRFPPAVSRREPLWLSKLGYEIRSLFEEVYTALHANSRRLAVTGARTLLDIFITQNVGNDGTFAERLKRLEEQRFVSPRNREFLEAALDAGSAAAHRGYSPSPSHLDYVMDIVENLFHGQLIAAGVESLRKATPPRPKKEPSGA